MLRKVADGVYWIEDADGLPMALVTALDDGTSLKAAGPWWAASRRMRDLGWPAFPVKKKMGHFVARCPG